MSLLTLRASYAASSPYRPTIRYNIRMSASAPDHTAAKAVVSNDNALVIFCDQARELFAQQQRRVQLLEADLSQQIETAIEEIKLSDGPVDEREARFCQLDQELTKLSNERDQAIEARAEAESLLDEARSATAKVSHEQHDLRVQLSQCHKQLNARAEELNELRTRLQNSVGEQSPQVTDKLRSLETKCDSLREQLSEAQQQLADAGSGSSNDSGELDELRQRFETAVQEIRGLKDRNNELSGQLAGSMQQDEVPVGGFDWEAQKRRLMMQLESDFDESDEQQSSEKLTVEGTIRITDQVIAEKDCEIEELKQMLDNQSSSIGDVAVGAAAIAEFLDQDDLIIQERESLKQLQEEWQDKLRQAEIDVSLERAKLGRERMDLQSQIQTIEQQRQSDESLSDGEKSDDRKPGGRWRKRLGLKDD